MDYDEALNIMVKFKLDGKDIGELYEKVVADKTTRLHRETFVIKLAELLQYLGIERNIGIDKNDKGFIKKENVLQNIKAYPRLMTKDINTLKEKCAIIQDVSNMDKSSINEILKNGVYVHSVGKDKLYISTHILQQFQVKTEKDGIINAVEYLLKNKQSKILLAPQKIYYRLMHVKELNGGTCINRIDFESCLREQARFETKYGTKDEILQKKYVLPKFNQEKPEEFDVLIKQEMNQEERE